jgi:hypothetical protein
MANFLKRRPWVSASKVYAPDYGIEGELRFAQQELLVAESKVRALHDDLDISVVQIIQKTEEFEALRAAGQLMANVMGKLAQADAHSEHDREIFRSLQIAWDKAARRPPAAESVDLPERPRS